MISKDPMVLCFESVAGDAKKFSTWKKTANVVLKLMKTLQTEVISVGLQTSEARNTIRSYSYGSSKQRMKKRRE